MASQAMSPLSKERLRSLSCMISSEKAIETVMRNGSQASERGVMRRQPSPAHRATATVVSRCRWPSVRSIQGARLPLQQSFWILPVS